MKNSSYLPTYEDGTECSETSAYKIQTPGNYPEGSIQRVSSVFTVMVISECLQMRKNS